MEYSLDILSEQDKPFKQYSLEGESVIGIEKNEPFKLRFINRGHQSVQVRLSVDGTDILTGEPASTKPTGKMWLVKAYDTMVLNAWPETDQSGAKFVFTAQDKSVAVNTHGVTAGVGLIAAAVYIDAHRPAPVLYSSGFPFGNRIPGVYSEIGAVRGMRLQSRNTKGSSYSNESKSLDLCFDAEPVYGASLSRDISEEKLAVGAGEQVAQKIATAAGLTKPMLDYMMQVRYLPWKQLEKRLGSPGTNAFPGDKPQKHIDLSNVPRTISKQAQLFERFA